MNKKGILCVANWDSNVGYAWWLMESFWVRMAEHYSKNYNVYLAYPTITFIPEAVDASSLVIKKEDFRHASSIVQVIKQCVFIRKYRIEYIYYSDRPFFAIRYALFRFVGVKKIVVHDHTPGLRSLPTGLKKTIKELRSSLSLFNCDVVIGATDFVRKRCVEVSCFPKEKCFSVPNGIPLYEGERGVIDVYKKFNIPRKRIVIVSTGRVSLYKGIDFALKVVEGLIKKGVHVHYLYLGDGPDIDQCKQLALEEGIENYVSFPGGVECVDEYLRSCGIAFHPSRGEVGYSLSILEYMRSGLPVVVPDNPSVSGATEHMNTGLIYRDNDVSSAVNNISELVNDTELRKKLGKNSSDKIIKEFALEKCHRKFINVMNQVIFNG